MVSVVPTANVNIFYRRMGRVYDAWDELIKTDNIVMPVGQLDSMEYCKSLSIQGWLFNIDIPDILMIFSKNVIIFLAGKEKIDFLKPLQDKVPSNSKVPKIELFVKDRTDNRENFQKILALIKSNGKNIGISSKEKFSGDFYSECIKAIFNNDNDFEKHDVSAALAYILAVKEDDELQYIQKACTATETIYSRVLVKELTHIIDKERKVSHRKLSAKLNDAISKDASRLLEGFNKDLVDTSYIPIIQSGGNYTLKFAAMSNDDDIHFGTIISFLGIRYHRYCSNISRTLVINPSEDQKKNYEFLLEVFDELMKNLTDGVLLSALHNKVVDFVKSKRPDLVDKLTKNFGFVTGIEFREGHLVIGPKTNFKAKKNMTFVISAGFTDLINSSASDSKGKNYALFVSDTVVVSDRGTPANLLTQKKRKLTKTMLLLKNDDESSEESDEGSNNRNGVENDIVITEGLRGSRRRVLEERLRQEQYSDKKRREHQRELLEQLNREVQARLSNGSGQKVKKFKSRIDELKDLFIRPNLYQKRISGSLEAHVNGFRFTSIRNDKIDILYNNIKHAIYQPCDGEMIILLHFNLKNPIVINKKKQYDIQFYTEVGEITTDLGKRQHMHDRDDYAAEAAERELRNRLKLAFKSFCDKVETSTKGEVQFEVPIRELGFYGVPKKSNVFLQPTPNALVNLTDPDPTVITLSEIELVHFERVSFHLKNFDMSIIFKDYNIRPLGIAAVEMSKLEDIKNWLDRCDIKFTSGDRNLNWPVVMKTVKNDPDFFLNGGWSFLEGDDDEEGEEEDEEDDDDQYDPNEDEDEEEDEDETEMSEEESEYEEESNDPEELGSSEESGKDWSELEEEAAKADRNSRYDDAPATTARRHNGASSKRKSYDDGRGGGNKKRG